MVSMVNSSYWSYREKSSYINFYRSDIQYLYGKGVLTDDWMCVKKTMSRNLMLSACSILTVYSVDNRIFLFLQPASNVHRNSIVFFLFFFYGINFQSFIYVNKWITLLFYTFVKVDIKILEYYSMMIIDQLQCFNPSSGYNN